MDFELEAIIAGAFATVWFEEVARDSDGMGSSGARDFEPGASMLGLRGGGFVPVELALTARCCDCAEVAACGLRESCE